MTSPSAPDSNIDAMTPVYFNRLLSDEERRERVFRGAIFIHSAQPGIAQLAAWARELIEDAFHGVPDILQAHRHLSVQEFIRRASPLKGRFTNDPRTKRLCQELIETLGADPGRTYFDLPRLRLIPPREYLSAGVSYNYAPHRDTWYAHPRQLVNFWAPLFDTEESTVMTMFIDQFRRPVQNSSASWNYDDWLRNSRFSAAQNVQSEQRAHPLPLEAVGGTTQLRLVLNGGDVMIFSTCQLHASTPNATDFVRYSLDLRTLNIDDLLLDRGPENVDGLATGSTLPDFLRGRDLVPLDLEPQRRAS